MKPLSTALKRLQHKGRYSKHTPYPTHRLMLQSTQLTHRSMTQTHTSWRYTQKHDADTNPPIIKIHTEAQCRHMRTLHEGYASYTQKHDADTCAWDVRAVGPIHDCQHQFLSLWILWAILALLKTVNTDFCLCGYCERYWPYTWLSTPISVSVDIVVHCDEFPAKNDQNKFHIQPCSNQPEWKQDKQPQSIAGSHSPTAANRSGNQKQSIHFVCKQNIFGIIFFAAPCQYQWKKLKPYRHATVLSAPLILH